MGLHVPFCLRTVNLEHFGENIHMLRNNQLAAAAEGGTRVGLCWLKSGLRFAVTAVPFLGSCSKRQGSEGQFGGVITAASVTEGVCGE